MSKNRRKSNRNPAPEGLRIADAVACTPANPSRRKWLFRFFALLMLPAFLIAVEVSLRLFGFGYDTGFFRTARFNGKDYLVNNENFSLRFFPPQLARSPDPVMIPAQKPPNTYRIFILGESAARGDPQMPYSASRYMEALLTARFPATHFEVVNLGITGIDSHVILPIARDCEAAGGDLWIIYMGNNEMVGPFGAATVFGLKAPPLWLVRLNLEIQRTRLAQCVSAMTRKARTDERNPVWRGMEMFIGNEVPPDDKRRETVYRNFERNLSDIIGAGLGSGTKVLLNTVGVNLKDCPPFAWSTNANLSAGDMEKFRQHLDRGAEEQSRKQFAASVQEYQAALNVVPQFALAEYRWGQCELALSNTATAREHFQNACNCDSLPFRTDSRINGAIREAAIKKKEGLTFFDAGAALEAKCKGGICGSEVFYEHVHFNFNGDFILGHAWAEEVEKLLPPGTSREGRAEWVSREACEQRLGLTDWNRLDMLQRAMESLRGPPLSTQPNNEGRLSALSNEVRQIRSRLNQISVVTAQRVSENAAKQSPTDHFVLEGFADFLEMNGYSKKSADIRARVCQLLPFDARSHFQNGRALFIIGDRSEAEAELQQAVALRPRFVEARGWLGKAHEALGRLDLALADYETSAILNPVDPTYKACMGHVQFKLNKPEEAIRSYRQAVRIDPDLIAAHLALADEFSRSGKFDDAKQEYAEAVRIEPSDALSHLSLGMMDVKLDKLDDATRQFRECLRLDPTNEYAHKFIDQLQSGILQRQ